VGLSSFASKPIEEVVAANPQTFFQVYWCGTRDQIQQRLDRAKRAGAVGLIVTLDWSFSHGRDWGSPFIPEQIDVRTMVRMAPEVLRRPRWLAGWARAGELPDLTVPNMTLPSEPPRRFFQAVQATAITRGSPRGVVTCRRSSRTTASAAGRSTRRRHR
jgi:hypothetical protein